MHESPHQHPLKAWRKSKNLTRKQLSVQAGVSVVTIYMIENGRKIPATKTIRKLVHLAFPVLRADDFM